MFCECCCSLVLVVDCWPLQFWAQWNLLLGCIWSCLLRVWQFLDGENGVASLVYSAGISLSAWLFLKRSYPDCYGPNGAATSKKAFPVSFYPPCWLSLIVLSVLRVVCSPASVCCANMRMTPPRWDALRGMIGCTGIRTSFFDIVLSLRIFRSVADTRVRKRIKKWHQSNSCTADG